MPHSRALVRHQAAELLASTGVVRAGAMRKCERRRTKIGSYSPWPITNEMPYGYSVGCVSIALASPKDFAAKFLPIESQA